MKSTQLLLLALLRSWSSCFYLTKKFKSTHQFTNRQLPQTQGVCVDTEPQVKDIATIKVAGDSKGSTSIEQRANTTDNEFTKYGARILP